MNSKSCYGLLGAGLWWWSSQQGGVAPAKGLAPFSS
ncbi:hypothetical protein LEMLEM_LOCUS1661 [Lemmus lemmus]